MLLLARADGLRRVLEKVVGADLPLRSTHAMAFVTFPRESISPYVAPIGVPPASFLLSYLHSIPLAICNALLFVFRRF